MQFDDVRALTYDYFQTGLYARRTFSEIRGAHAQSEKPTVRLVPRARFHLKVGEKR